MKNEKDFKKRISEIAANIAGNLNEYDAGKINIPSSILVKYNSNIQNAADLAEALYDFMQEILADEPSLKGIEDRSGWNSVATNLKRLAGMDDDPNLMYDKKPIKDPELKKQADKLRQDDLDALKETYERIKRK